MHRPTQEGASDPEPGRRTKGPGPANPQLTRRSTGPGGETRRCMNRLERPYQRPVPGPRATPSWWRGRRTPREQERTHTQRTRGADLNGNRTEPAEQNSWNGVRAGEGKGHPDRTTRNTHREEHRGRGGGQGGDARAGTGPDPPSLLRAPGTHNQGTAPALAVVAHSATHQPRG